MKSFNFIPCQPYLSPIKLNLRKFKLESVTCSNKVFKNFQKKSDFGGQRVILGPRSSRQLHFKPIKSIWTDCGDVLQPKTRSKHEKQRHLVSEMKVRLFFVLQDSFHYLRTVFGMCYYPVKSPFSAFPSLVISSDKVFCHISTKFKNHYFKLLSAKKNIMSLIAFKHFIHVDSCSDSNCSELVG